MNRTDINKLFNELATSYDKANVCFSLGIDHYWRKKLIDLIPKKEYLCHIDVACGTGAIIKRTSQKFSGKFVGVDVSSEMLKIARSIIKDRSVKIIHGDGTNLSFPDNSFDVLTNGFGLRNFSDHYKGIKESYRILKPGGHALFLDFQLPKNKLFKILYRFYLHKLMPTLGRLISKNMDSWIYLGASIEFFAENVDLISDMKEVGFTEVTSYPMTFGIASVFKGKKNEIQTMD